MEEPQTKKPCRFTRLFCLADSKLRFPNDPDSPDDMKFEGIPEAIRDINLPDTFIEDLEAIEQFYDLFLEDIIPLDQFDEEAGDT